MKSLQEKLTDAISELRQRLDKIESELSQPSDVTDEVMEQWLAAIQSCCPSDTESPESPESPENAEIAENATPAADEEPVVLEVATDKSELEPLEADTPIEDEEITDPTEDATTVDAMPLRRMFTLNDRFRFRRELFGNLDAMMNETLETLAAMNSLDEALEYLENDLCWDMTVQEVEDFVTVLYRYYNSLKR